MTDEEELFVALLVINKGNNATSYRMCKFINSFFEIWNCEKIINGLIDNKYVYYKDEEQVKKFSLSLKGREAVAQNQLWIIELLKKEFPQNIDIIENL